MKKIFFFSYSIFLLLITVFSYLFIDQNFVYLHEMYLYLPVLGKFVKVIIFLTVLVVFFLFYIFILYSYRKKRLTEHDARKLIITTVVCLYLSYPAMLSHDIFNYIAAAKVTFFYGENPYIIMPIEFTGDQLLLFMHAANKTALYGPVWVMLSGIPFALGMGQFLLTMFLFKGFVASFYLVSLLLIYKLSRNFFSVLFFGLNPLVILETLVSGHNDIVMVCFLLLAYLLFLQKKVFFSSIFILASILIKFATIVLMPLYVVLLLKKIKKQKIDWERIFALSFILLFAIFLLSFLREEIYPWYAIWFLPFVGMIRQKKLQYLAVIFSFSLLLRYIPFMILMTHFGITPILKTAVTFLPLFVSISWIVVKERVWLKRTFR